MSSSPSSTMPLPISLHNSAPFKLLIFSLILSSSLSKTNSAALLGCHSKCTDSNIPYSLGIFVLLAPLFAGTWIIWSQQKKKLEHHRMSVFDRNGGNILKKKLSKRKRSASEHLKIYTAQDMKIATNDYSDSRSVMQRCNPGTFFRGTLENREVVVMKIPAAVPASKVEQFVDEVIFLSLPHRNLVRVLGCCLETSFPLLVYELHGDGNRTLSDCMGSADIPPRFSPSKAAAAVARGLAYLRSRNPRGAEFYHGSICGGNVLLDDSFDAKLFYSAASSLVDRNVSSLDSENIDVYGFGVVLNELLRCGNDEVKMRSEKVVKEVIAMAARCLSVRLEERPTITELEAKLTAWDNDVKFRLTALR